MADLMPPVWKRLYDNLEAMGFTEEEAMKLLQTFILSQCPFGVRGPG